MTLLIFTQKVDIEDPILGFFHRWIEEFSKHFENIIVICLYKGKYDLPENVEVYSLGKEEGKSKFTYIYRFYKYIFTLKYDSVFVHMNQIYVILGGLFWRLMGKKIGLWYMHKNVGLTLYVAEKFVSNIFTATKESFRLKSTKINVVGHGIDVKRFKRNIQKEKSNVLKIVTIGRISPSKDYETLIKAVELLVKEGINLKVKIVGGAGTDSQESYFSELKTIVNEKKLSNFIEFTGPVRHDSINLYLNESDIFINTSHTGSLDKAILEAMASGLIVQTCNEAAKESLGEYSKILMFPKRDHKKLSQGIKSIIDLDLEERKKISTYLRNSVEKNHNLENLVVKIISRI